MSAVPVESNDHGNPDEPDGVVFSKRVFIFSIAGACAVIVLMIIAGDFW